MDNEKRYLESIKDYGPQLRPEEVIFCLGIEEGEQYKCIRLTVVPKEEWNEEKKIKWNEDNLHYVKDILGDVKFSDGSEVEINTLYRHLEKGEEVDLKEVIKEVASLGFEYSPELSEWLKTSEDPKTFEDFEERFGHQYRPEEVIFCIFPEEFDEEEDILTHPTIYITAEKYFEENECVDKDDFEYQYVGSLIEGEDIENEEGREDEFTEKEYYQLANNIWQPSIFKTENECRAYLESLGLRYSEKFDKYMNEYSEKFMKQEEDIPENLKEEYQRIVEVLKKMKEKFGNYQFDYYLFPSELDEVSKTIPLDDQIERWEEKLNSLGIYSYEGDLYIVVNHCWDCEFCTFPKEAKEKIIEILGKFTIDNLPPLEESEE